jgi:hypothetical protein
MWFEVPKEFRKIPEAIEMLRIDAEFTRVCADELEAVRSKLWERSPAEFDALSERSRSLQESLKAAVAAYDQATGEPKAIELPHDLSRAVAEQFDGDERDRVVKLLSKALATLRRQQCNDPRIGFCILKLAGGDARRVEHIAREACIDFRDVIVAAEGMPRDPNP